VTRPAAPLSLDLDDKWSYLKTHGNSSWSTYPSYLETVVPRVHAVLSACRVRLTVFIVGRDATDASNHDAMGSLVTAGHEIGNHSFMHEPWLHLYSADELRTDLRRAHEAIREATGVDPRGFRGPGFSLSRATLSELSDLGYAYDATLFPNILNPLGRYYYFMRSNLSAEERKRRKALFGTVRDAVRPNVPFIWEIGDSDLLEIPVTTMPGIRTPFHFSYLIFLAGISERLAFTYLQLGLRLCRMRGVPPSLLLHPLDFLGVEDEPDLGFFPGMTMPRGHKIELTTRFIDEVSKHYRLGPIDAYLQDLRPSRHQPADQLRR
jgi:hypothetical protein